MIKFLIGFGAGVVFTIVLSVWLSGRIGMPPCYYNDRNNRDDP